MNSKPFYLEICNDGGMLFPYYWELRNVDMLIHSNHEYASKGLARKDAEIFIKKNKLRVMEEIE